MPARVLGISKQPIYSLMTKDSGHWTPIMASGIMSLLQALGEKTGLEKITVY